MGSTTGKLESGGGSGANSVWRSLYRAFAYLGLFSIFASLAFGFRYDSQAAPINYAWNLLLYGVFITPHLLMTRSWWKQTFWGNPAGSPAERRVYIIVTLVTWGAVLWLHQPVPGWSLGLWFADSSGDASATAIGSLEFANPWVTVVRFGGMVLFLFCVFLFFEGVTRTMLDGLLGVPGAGGAYSHGPNTPLFTEGAYAEVRHPMYRAAVLGGLASLLIHPNTAQLFWAGLLGLTFIAFIPVEEAQMIRARGDDYRAYQQQTRWRLFRGIW